jgi:hypothetical protein
LEMFSLVGQSFRERKKKKKKKSYFMGKKVKEMVHNLKSNNSDKMMTATAVKNVRNTTV